MQTVIEKNGDLTLILEETDGDYSDIYDAMESDGGATGGLLGNGWRSVSPEEIGALIGDECLILTQDWDEDDQGNLTRIGDYWFDNLYAIRNPLDELIEKNTLTLMKGPNENPIAEHIKLSTALRSEEK